MRQVVACKRLEAQKVVAVAYRRWSFTICSNCKALTAKVAGGRTWSMMEVKL